jgi:hypothetical protein
MGLPRFFASVLGFLVAATAIQAQDFEWTARFGPASGKTASGKAVAVDSADNVFVAGDVLGLHGTGIVTVKYNSLGETQWAKRYDNPAQRGVESRKIAIDSFGNVYVAGNEANATISEIVVLKYDPDGNRLWRRTFNMPGGKGDSMNAMAVDSAGNVYIAGTNTSKDFTTAFLTVKYSPSGSFRWARLVKGKVVQETNIAFDIRLDNSGDPIVTGFHRTPISSDESVTVKYNTDGMALWVKRFKGTDSRTNALAVDSEDNVVLTGKDGSELLVLKLSSGGQQLWHRKIFGFEGARAAGTLIAVDAQDNILVCGGDNGTPTSIMIAKYDPTGLRLWNRRLLSTFGGDASPRALLVDSQGSAIVVGFFDRSDGNRDGVAVKYDSLGTRLYSRIVGNGTESERLVAASMAGQDRYVVTGSKTTSTKEIYLTVKFKP